MNGERRWSRAVGHPDASARRDEERDFERGVAALADYARAEGGVEVPGGWCDQSGFPLGAWVAEQRLRRLEDRLEPGRCQRLERIDGWCWSPPDPPA